LPLQRYDIVDEGMIAPRFFAAESVTEGDNVRRGLLDDRVPSGLKQAQDGCFPSPGGAGQNVCEHCSSFRTDRAD
jgi:hypothetical protein